MNPTRTGVPAHRRTVGCFRLVPVILALWAGSTENAGAQQPARPTGRPAAQPAAPAAAAPQQAPAAAQPQAPAAAPQNGAVPLQVPVPPAGRLVAITNATILTATHGTIEHGTILIRDGRIAEVGTNVQVPAGAQVIDGTGKFVMPGIIDSHSHTALEAVNEGTNSVTSEVRVGRAA